MAHITAGGQLESIQRDEKIYAITISCEQKGGGLVNLWINGNSLSYLTIQEAMELRDEINIAIKEATGI